MKKIPTLFVRDFTEPSNGRYVTREVHPDCQWVLDGEGVATRKYDGTCVMFDGTTWWARREVKGGKREPAGFVAIETDDVTGKTVGWEPIEQSAFARYHAEVLAASPDDFRIVDEYRYLNRTQPGTYELLGPKVNGNPEGVEHHLLVRHGYTAAVDAREMALLGRTYDEIADWFAAPQHVRWEGIVWHHADGLMAKIKRRDFLAVSR